MKQQREPAGHNSRAQSRRGGCNPDSSITTEGIDARLGDAPGRQRRTKSEGWPAVSTASSAASPPHEEPHQRHQQRATFTSCGAKRVADLALRVGEVIQACVLEGVLRVGLKARGSLLAEREAGDHEA
eukprot:CAMPEP_0204116658 /NCGR_PEP_ID=MMETSP0361-20130328/5541_1 /ASSEMBLY_ACC=CAM_ASM_000343 /TAXON_ID=268821 /ORGANISM="Scrippsiella Hangoei, Strain SHTV-5" /LENGTH=127 /DNA_ID=CAMNT_0051067485 /DNA_START=494 /DNA_END=873 /DNA_ORIENTATION=+